MLTRKVEVKVPEVPDFISVGEMSMSLDEFNHAELKRLGREWTKALISRANELTREKIKEKRRAAKGPQSEMSV